MLAPLLALAAATAAPAPSELAGIWEGTVGNLPVRACFSHRESGDFGAYYYLSRLRLIPLDAEEGTGGAFHEGGGTEQGSPRWMIERAEAESLTARWTGGTRTLPVRLRRVARMEDDESPCSSPVFHQPRLEGVRTVTSRASLDGVAYSRIQLDVGERYDVSVETFALDGEGEAAQRINAALRSSLASSPPQWFECIQDSLGYHAFEGALAESLVPAMITGRWLSVSHHWDGDCGGAHPETSNNYRTFDLTAGREVNLHDWFNQAAVKRERLEGLEEDVTTLRPEFKRVVLEGWRAEDAECGEIVRDEEYWNIGLGRRGLVFQPLLPRVVQACGDEFIVPFSRLRPFLTEEGAANLRALEAESLARSQTAPAM